MSDILENKKANTHKNHRKRLKTKVRDYGLECLAHHEILELLLTYSIPRKDTNPLAHNLIEYFGSFSKVFDATYEDLLKVDGIGQESALFLKVLSSFIDVYNKSNANKKVEILNSPAECVKFFRKNYQIKSNEYMVMACLSKNKRVIKTFLYKGRDDVSIGCDLRRIANNINNEGVCSVVLFHTHPNGSVEPSEEDILTTQRIVNLCLVHGIDFDEHLILNETEHYSFKKLGNLAEMKAKYISVFCVLPENVKKDKNKTK